MSDSLAGTIDAAETFLDRGLTGDEVALVSRMHQAGRERADILKMLDQEVEQPKDPDGGVHRFEVAGNAVRRVQ